MAKTNERIWDSTLFFSVDAKMPVFPEIVDEELKIRLSLFYFCEYGRLEEDMPLSPIV